MKGKWIYFAASSLMGILTVFLNPVILLSAMFVLTLFLYNKKRFSKRRIFFLLLIFLVFFIRSELAEKQNKTKLTGNEDLFYISLVKDLKQDGDLFSATVKDLINNESLIIRYKMKTEKEKELLGQNLQIGMTCKVKGTLEEPSTAANPNAFDYKEYLNQKQTFWILKIDNLTLSKCNSQKTSLPTFFAKLRQNGIMYVQDHFPEKTGPLAAALIFGESDLLDADVFKSYQQLGIVHLLAISGGHVGMIVGMLFYIGIRAGMEREKMLDFLILFLPCYALLTGAAPSVVRAVLMLLFILLAKKLKSSFLIQDVICIVFIAYTFFMPYVVFDVGFQLSFAVSFALILSAPYLLKQFFNPLSFLFITSFICQLAAAPILFWYFFEISLISVIANVLFVPLFTFILVPVISILFFLHLLMGERIQLVLEVLNTFLYWMDTAAEKFADIPFAVLTLGRPPIFVILLYLLIIPVFFSLWERRAGLKSFIQIFLLPLTVIFLHFFANTLSPNGEITFIDVGQGDSILIKMPYGKGNYLIDTGGTINFNTEEWKVKKKQYDVGLETVVPFLKSRGINQLDKLILTHGDADHMGGAFAILNEIKVKEIVLPVVKDFSNLEKDLISEAKSKKIPVRFTKEGKIWGVSGTKFYVLSPQEGMGENKNDGSIVIYSHIGGVKWLFTGDLEENGEERLISQYPKLKIDVLKVGHHGSKTSTSDLFLSSLDPKVAIISSGKNNRYGHPNGEVLERLRDRKVKVLRIDEHGAITYFFKGNNGTFSSQLP